MKEGQQVKCTSLINGEIIEGAFVKKVALGYLGIHFGYEVKLISGEVILLRDSFYSIELQDVTA